MCNDETNNEDCDYDGGDCCLSDKNTELCSECICYPQASCTAGIIPSIVGDGFCHDETNNVECNYDGGDCCKKSVKKEFCSKCECIEGELKPLNDINSLNKAVL